MLIEALIEGFHDRPPPADQENFVDRLRLRRVDRDIFTGWCHAGSPMRAFGGQVAAQALVAAGATVDDDARSVHSLHAYFLRPGRTTDHIVYMVDRPRDGRTFSTRRVRAVQYGEVIFTLSASFNGPQEGPQHQRGGIPPAWWDHVPAPESLEPEQVFDHIAMSLDGDRGRRNEVLQQAGYPEQQRFDLRVVEPDQALEASGGQFDRMIWLRSVQHLPADQLLNVCVLTYFSDLNLAGTVTGQHGGRQNAGAFDVASLDHAMWFHNPFRAVEWNLMATASPAAGHGRGFARGEFFDHQGVLTASTAQEVLVRYPFDKG